jgi:hypothetical protein
MSLIEGHGNLCKSFDAYNLVDIPHRYFNQSSSESEIDNAGEYIVKEIKTLEKKDVIILLNVDETAPEVVMIYWCNSLTKHLSKTSLNYVILTNYTFKYADDNDRVISLHWFLHATVSVYTKDNIEKLPWKSTNTSVLFLPGKPWKPSRLPALYYFLRSSLRHNLKYSSITFKEMMNYENQETEDLALQLLQSWNLVYGTAKSYSINEVRTVMNRLAKELDGQWNWLWHDNLLHPTMYSDVGVEIVAETSPVAENFITEKTYKPIVLGYPFVYMHSNFIHPIISQGFKVYQPMVPRGHRILFGLPGTWDNNDWKIEFETCVENTEKVLNNMKSEYMESAIKHNQQHAMDLHQETINNIAKIIPGFEEYAREIFSRNIELHPENPA